MSTKSEVYREIIKAIAKVFSGISLALGSFISIVFVLVIDVPGNVVRFSGYEITFTPTLVLFTTSLSLSCLVIACLTFVFLLLLETENASANDQ